MEPSPMARQLQKTRLMMYATFGVTEALGVVAVFLVLNWVVHSLGGFAWDGSSQQFNWHPFLMVTAFAFLMGNSLVLYRVFYFLDKKVAKVAHSAIHTASLVCIMLALYAVIDNHNHSNTNNMYSLHSWIGMTTCVLFFLQLVFGFAAYLVPQMFSPRRSMVKMYKYFWAKFPESIKANMMPIHRFMGTLIFCMGIASIISGISEKAIFTYAGEYQHLPGWSVEANLLGLAVALYAVGIGILVTNPSFRREDNIAQMWENLND